MAFEVNQTRVETEGVDENWPEEPSHHVQAELCRTRAPYRQGRRLTAVKVYTANNESKHLIVAGVPAVGLRRELKSLLSKYGDVSLTRMSVRNFTEKYHVRYADSRAARIAKRFLDEKNYYGGSLHICYAPELETVADTRAKLMLRRREIAARLHRMKVSEVQESRRTQQQAQQPYAAEFHCVSDTTEATHVERSAEGARKRKQTITNTVVLEKQYRPCFLPQPAATPGRTSDTIHSEEVSVPQSNDTTAQDSNQPVFSTDSDQPVLSTRSHGSREPKKAEKITLNYDKFGNEDVRIVPAAPVNKIRFNVARKQ